MEITIAFFFPRERQQRTGVQDASEHCWRFFPWHDLEDWDLEHGYRWVNIIVGCIGIEASKRGAGRSDTDR